VFRFGTESPASILLDAVEQLEHQSPKADDNIQLIRPNLVEAVDACVSFLFNLCVDSHLTYRKGQSGRPRIQYSLAETTFKGGLFWKICSRYL
jgi:Vps16, N-terminal region